MIKADYSNTSIWQIRKDIDNICRHYWTLITNTRRLDNDYAYGTALTTVAEKIKQGTIDRYTAFDLISKLARKHVKEYGKGNKISL